MLHWTKPSQNWNTQCAECHSTNLRKGYRLDEDRFVTTFSEIDVSCEACHGPGSRHVAWARQAKARGQEPKGEPGLIVRFTERRSRDVGDGRGARDREAHEVPRDALRGRDLRPLPRAAGPPHRGVPRRAAARARRTARRSSTRASTTRTGRCGTRSTTGARSSRAGCTRPASPARTATTPHGLKVKVGPRRRLLVLPPARAVREPQAPLPPGEAARAPPASPATCATETYMVVDPRHDHSLPGAAAGPHRRARPRERPERLQRLPPRPLGRSGRRGRCGGGTPAGSRRSRTTRSPSTRAATFQPAAEPALLEVIRNAKQPGDRARARRCRCCRRTSGPSRSPRWRRRPPTPTRSCGWGRPRRSRRCPPKERVRIGVHLLWDPVRAVRVEAVPAFADVPGRRARHGGSGRPSTARSTTSSSRSGRTPSAPSRT